MGFAGSSDIFHVEKTDQMEALEYKSIHWQPAGHH
jgi:hypothetical protein